MMTATCTVCEARIDLPNDCTEGELLICGDCGTELEVISLTRVSVEEAPRSRRTGESSLDCTAHTLYET